MMPQQRLFFEQPTDVTRPASQDRALKQLEQFSATRALKARPVLQLNSLVFTLLAQCRAYLAQITVGIETFNHPKEL